MLRVTWRGCVRGWDWNPDLGWLPGTWSQPPLYPSGSVAPYLVLTLIVLLISSLHTPAPHSHQGPCPIWSGVLEAVADSFLKPALSVCSHHLLWPFLLGARVLPSPKLTSSHPAHPTHYLQALPQHPLVSLLFFFSLLPPSGRPTCPGLLHLMAPPLLSATACSFSLHPGISQENLPLAASMPYPQLPRSHSLVAEQELRCWFLTLSVALPTPHILAVESL